LTLTTLFPNAANPRHGIFTANRLARMRDAGCIDPLVVAAIPWFPGAYREISPVPYEETIFGMAVGHPRYPNIPGIGMRVQPAFLARALLRELANRGADGSSFDMIDAHYFYPDGVAAARVARRLDLPLVITALGSDINVIGAIRFAQRAMLGAADAARACIAVSAALASSMAQLGMDKERIHVIRNAVDGEVFHPVPKSEARRRLDLDAHCHWVLGVGNLLPVKGFELLIRAMPCVAGARLLLVGEGPLRKDLDALAAKIAPGVVEFRANMPQSELRFAYSACDVFALPSVKEGWPNVVLEAIACGAPVVASPVGGVPEILGDGSPGKLVAERSAEAWAEALSAMLARSMDPQEVRQYALAFGWDEVVAAQCALYEDVLDASEAHKRERAS
jgi:glycosyltransferase involved in cell wall biosynthesis